jgi:hypothetical protein
MCQRPLAVEYGISTTATTEKEDGHMSSSTCTPALRPALRRRAVLSERRSCRLGQQPANGQGPPVMARELRPGDVVQQYDWSLHVRGVKVSQAAVAIAVTEFGFPLRYAVDAQVQLAA